MNTKPTHAESEMGELIDRLVCGEIDETARGRLIAWLEAEPARWRTCGLAFLESQIWSLALSSWSGAERGIGLQPAAGSAPASADGFGEPSYADGKPTPGRRRFARPSYTAVLAASVLVAFGLGVLSAGMLGGPALESAPIASGHSGGTNNSILEPKITAGKDDSQKPPSVQRPILAAFAARAGAVETTVQIPVVSVGEAREAVDAPPAVPDYVRQQWERRGFDVQTQRRYLFAVLPNGERAVVPVDNVKFRPIPINVY